jgi:paraquat-inducible protein B
MSEAQGPRTTGGPAEAVIRTRSRPSIVWLIPIVAALVGGWVAWRSFSERGPAITIRMQSAEGLEAGKTEVKFKDVAVGLVETIELEPDLSGVIVHARMVKGAERWLTENTRFWVVKPRIAGGQVSGLGTLLSGSYIGVDPVTEGESRRKFDALAEAPLVAMKEAGRYFNLVSDRAGAVDTGVPVYFRSIAVGQVISSELDPVGDTVKTRVFVRAPYDQRVHADSRWWNAGGVEAALSADGIRVDMPSVVSLLVGGIAFDAPHGEETEVAEADAVFPLYENKFAADQRHYTHTIAWLLRFDQSVRGLKVGAPVEFRGIPIGQVTDVRIEFDRAAQQFRIPVTVEIEPERFTQQQASPEERRAAVDKLVAAGMRAQLKSGSLITGSLFVSLDFFPNAKPAKMAWDTPVPEFPTTPTPIEEVTANLTQIVDRLNKIPLDQIGTDLGASLKSLRTTLAKSENIGPALTNTLEQTQKTLQSVGPDSNVNIELRRALVELTDAARALGLAADQIQTQPDSLLFGKEGSK